MQQSVVVPIEEDLETLDHIKEAKTTINLGSAYSYIRFEHGVDIKEKERKVTSILNNLKAKLPSELETHVKQISIAGFIVALGLIVDNRIGRLPRPPSFLNGLIPFRDKVYKRILRWILRHPWTTTGTVMIMLFSSLATATRLDIIVFPESDDPYFRVECGSARFMPILLTSVTTITALIPMAVTDTMFKPMAIVIIGGLLSSTVIMLFFIPLLFRYLTRKGKIPT